MVLVGEQPGNDEDLAGHPFVGPAGRLLDRALVEAGIERRALYVTNAVKHFKWKGESGGKRRIHDTPSRAEVEACRPWLKEELWVIQPRVMVCLGATAAQAGLGRRVSITSTRGRLLDSTFGIPTVITVHPSAILRIPDRPARDVEMKRFVADLRIAAETASR
jgi:DNA polymerase